MVCDDQAALDGNQPAVRLHELEVELRQGGIFRPQFTAQDLDLTAPVFPDQFQAAFEGVRGRRGILGRGQGGFVHWRVEFEAVEQRISGQQCSSGIRGCLGGLRQAGGGLCGDGRAAGGDHDRQNYNKNDFPFSMHFPHWHIRQVNGKPAAGITLQYRF